MATVKITIGALLIAFVSSNGLWAYRVLDLGVTLTYTRVNLDYHRQALNQALTLLPIVDRPGISRDEVLKAARMTTQSNDSFEQDGFVWVRRIGLKFNPEGRLNSAVRA